MHRYVIYAYTKEAYGTTGIEFDDNYEKAVDVAAKMQSETGVTHGVMVYVPGDSTYKRRLVWKDGSKIDREKRDVISTNCKIVISIIKDHVRINKKVPTVAEICDKTYKPKQFIEKTLRRLEEASLIEISNLTKQNNPYKLLKK